MKKLIYEIHDLNKDEKLEKRIITTCMFNNVKYTIQQGRILKIVNTNVSLIEPHRVDITIKGKDIIVIYFNIMIVWFCNSYFQVTYLPTFLIFHIYYLFLSKH